MIFIKLDVRERDLISLIQAKHAQSLSLSQSKNITILVETLPLGDIILSNDTSDLLMIERKSLRDLVASIKDGRYSEQSYRLDGSPLHNHNIMYLIEGDVNKGHFPNKQMIYSSLFSLNYCKGFSVVRTLSLDETAGFILYMAEYLGNPTKKGAYYSSPSFSLTNEVGGSGCKEVTDPDPDLDTEPETKVNYASVVKSVKKENITPNNIGEIMLSQIPGVSAASAIAIMKHFKYFVNLVAELQEQGSSCLNSVTLTNAKGAPRTLNKTCIANVAKYVLGED